MFALSSVFACLIGRIIRAADFHVQKACYVFADELLQTLQRLGLRVRIIMFKPI